MSTGARWLLAIAMLAMAAGFAWAGASGLVPSAAGCYVLAGVCLLIVVVAVGGKIGPIAGRVLGAGVFCVCVAYLVSQWHAPGAMDVTRYRRSQPNFINAIYAMIFFGIPGLVYAVWSRWIGRVRL